METYQISYKKPNMPNGNIYICNVTTGDYIENVLGEHGYVTGIYSDGFSWYNLVQKCAYIFKEEKADMVDKIILNLHSFFKRIGTCSFYQDSKNEITLPTVDKLVIPYSDKLNTAYSVKSEHYTTSVINTIVAKINEIIRALEAHKLTIEDLQDVMEEMD